MESTDKQQLIDAFQNFLEEEGELVEPTQQTDLYSLFVELAGLRTEVKHESRQFKTALDEFRELIGLMKNSHDQLHGTLQQNQQTFNALRRDALRPILLELLELHDRLESSVSLLGQQQLSGPRWLHRRASETLEAVSEGQSMSLRRVQKLLQQHQVEAITAVGRRLDPQAMRAVAVERRSELADGVVTEEVRKGFRWADEVLRQAEVKVNQLG